MSEEPEDAAITRAMDSLMEHWDAVQVLVTRVSEDGTQTVRCFRGRGNWYSRTGMAREFLTTDEGQITAKAQKDFECGEDGD